MRIIPIKSSLDNIKWCLADQRNSTSSSIISEAALQDLDVRVEARPDKQIIKTSSVIGSTESIDMFTIPGTSNF